jgi:prepilin-type processing-associated H-X9-DG protein/prepilin-type N-terminal cleavage/methylation domain-containing protein
MKRWAFTLVELLIVVAIIGVLASLLLPAISRGKQRARGAQCLNNLRQIGVASVLYASDNEDTIPQSQHSKASWVGTLQPYLSGTNLHRCPLDRKLLRGYSYAVNDFLTPHPSGAPDINYSKVTSLADPSETLQMAEMAETDDDTTGVDHFHFADPSDGGYAPSSFEMQVEVRRHEQRANYLFVDGHVLGIPWMALRGQLTQVGSRLINPAGHPGPPKTN